MQTTLGIFVILFLKHVQGGTLRPLQEAQSRPIPIYLAYCSEPVLASSSSLMIKGERIQKQLWFLKFANLVDPRLAYKKRGIQEPLPIPNTVTSPTPHMQSWLVFQDLSCKYKPIQSYGTL